MRHGIVVLAMIALLGVSIARAAGPVPKTDEEKTVYAIGVLISRNLVPFNLTPAEFELVKLGIADGLSNKKPKVEVEALGQKISDLLQARRAATAAVEKKDAQAFLDKAAAQKGAEKKPSGLIYTEVQAGDGQQPKASDQVKIQYTGMLRDGSVFDSSIQRGQPSEFPVHAVMPCWTEALQLMKVHGKAKIVCPSELAYGDKGAPPKIKPGAPLVFEIELLEVSPGGMGDGHAPHGATGPAPDAQGSEKKE